MGGGAEGAEEGGGGNCTHRKEQLIPFGPLTGSGRAGGMECTHHREQKSKYHRHDLSRNREHFVTPTKKQERHVLQARRGIHHQST